MKNVLGLVLIWVYTLQAKEPTFKVNKLLDNGSAKNRVNFVIMGDGYIRSEIPTFHKNAKAVADFMQRFSPYSNYASYINIYTIEVISNESGTDEKDKGIKKDTYLNSGFNHSMDRLLTADSAKCAATAARHLPEYGQIIVLVNTPRYGGSGGYISVSYNGGSSPQMNVHEVGHSFAGLADEYTYGHNDIIHYEPNKPNVTIQTSRDKIKWKRWIDSATPVPTPSNQIYNNKVGLFEGGYYRPKGVYRPQQNCMMKSMYSGFCKICNEAHIHKFQQKVNLIESHTPRFGQLSITDSFNFFVKTVSPSTHNLNTKWSINQVEKGTAPIFSIQPGSLKLGKNEVSVKVSDPQPDVKYPIPQSTRELKWNFMVIDTRTPMSPTAVPDTYNVKKNSLLKIDGIGITANDFDLNGDLFTASLVSPPKYGKLSLQPEGSFSYIPNQDFFGEDAFFYQINDGAMNSKPAKVTIKVVNQQTFSEDFASFPKGFFTTLPSPLGSFSATPKFFEVKRANKINYIHIHKQTKRTALILNLNDAVKKQKLKQLSFRLENLLPTASINSSLIEIDVKSNSEWTPFFKLKNIYPQSEFSVNLEGRSFEAFCFRFTSNAPFNLYEISLEENSIALKPPVTITAYKVNFDLGGKGIRTGGGRLAQRVIAKQAATAPVIQSKPGFKFKGWSTSFDHIASDTTVRALYQDIPGLTELQLNLKKGWNFISIPLKNANLKPLISAINGNCWKWGNKDHYKPVNSAEAQQGLWVNVKKDKSVLIKGDPISSNTLSLKFGWNAYGPYKDGAVPEDIQSIFSWENNRYKQLDSSSKLDRGKAYWIFSTKQKEIELKVEP